MGQKKSLHNKYYNHIQVCIVPGTTCCKFKYSVVSYQTLEITFLENLFMIYRGTWIFAASQLQLNMSKRLWTKTRQVGA